MKESKTKTNNNNDEEVRRIAEYLKYSVDWLCNKQEGCCAYRMDDHLAICVGWSIGYDEDAAGSVILALDDPNFGINAGIKVWTSDAFMLTDYDWINFPYFESGDVIDAGVSIAPNEDYKSLATNLLQLYDSLKDYKFENDGKIIE